MHLQKFTDKSQDDACLKSSNSNLSQQNTMTPQYEPVFKRSQSKTSNAGPSVLMCDYPHYHRKKLKLSIYLILILTFASFLLFAGIYVEIERLTDECGPRGILASPRDKQTEFNVSTNCTEFFFGITYQYPRSWAKNTETPNVIWYFPPNANQAIKVAFNQIQGSVVDPYARKSVLNQNEKTAKTTYTSEKKIEINDNPAYQYNGELKEGDKVYSYTLVLFDCSGGIMSIMIDETKSELNTSSYGDFRAMLHSIKVKMQG